MLTLCMDTSHKYLVLGLIDDEGVIAEYQAECWKKQSEEIFPELQNLLLNSGYTVDDINSVVITEGPGSYTGVRIAMTIAKVFCTMRKLPLYTVSSLLLLAGMEENALSLIDARGGRAYYGRFKSGSLIGTLDVKPIDEITFSDEIVVGDGHLIGKEDYYPDLVLRFFLLRDFWKQAENPHTVVPEYLKSSEAYMVKK